MSLGLKAFEIKCAYDGDAHLEVLGRWLRVTDNYDDSTFDESILIRLNKKSALDLAMHLIKVSEKL